MKSNPELSLEQLAVIRGKGSPEWKNLLAFDPGETVGWALFEGFELKASGQIRENLKTLGATSKLIRDLKPQLLVIEKFILYPWKAKHLSWSQLNTVQVIGAIRMIAAEECIPLAEQSAAVGKAFFTDALLKRLGLAVGGRHARDAVRHGATFLVFGDWQQFSTGG